MHGDGCMGEPTAEEFASAKVRGEARMRGPRAESACYEPSRDRVVVRLTTGAEFAFSPREVQGLPDAAAADLSAIEIDSFGLGLHFPKLDADLYVPALLREYSARSAGWRRDWGRPADGRERPRRRRHPAPMAIAAAGHARIPLLDASREGA